MGTPSGRTWGVLATLQAVRVATSSCDIDSLRWSKRTRRPAPHNRCKVFHRDEIMESFRWDKHFETGLETVDSQHHALVDLINRFGELIAQADVAPADIERLFVELTRYAGQHFREEEEMMVAVGVDRRHVDRHVQQHAQFLREVQQMRRGLDGGPGHSGALLKFLTYWLAYHILGVDQQMSRQVRAVRSVRPSTPRQRRLRV